MSADAPTVLDQMVHHAEPDDREDKTRRPLAFWDRVKVLVIIAVVLGFLVAYEHSQTPIMSYGEALEDQLRAKWWLVGLAGLECLRQAYNLVAEHSQGWYRFWQHAVFGGWERRMSRLNPWGRFRLQRLAKRTALFAVVFLFLSWKWHVSFSEAVVSSPTHLWDALFEPLTGGLPLFWMLVLYSVMGIFSLAIFYAIFFFDSSIETYKPGEIRTRFRDVWGQDPTLVRVKETVDFLEKPAEIEAKGGYVPNGILLWGPPGTGKTLMAEAIAGETGRPYVFVEPSAFIQTFVGVAPMKVRFMYRKLRKLSLRHGGVVVFFDEADALGNRGALGGQPNEARQAWEGMHACGGLRYVSDHARAAAWGDLVAMHGTTVPAEPTKRQIIMMGGGAGSGALQALLTAMSGLRKPKGFFARKVRSFLNMKQKEPPKYRILHVFATNMPDALDQAMLRPGRIDRMFHVGYPHAEGRRKTFEGYLSKVTHDLTPAQVERLSVITPYFTGAKIKDIVNEALIVAMRSGREVVTYADVLKAKGLKAHGEADNWKYTDLERHQVAVHEACHAVAMYRLQKRATIDTATIERRGGVGGFVAPIPLEERFGEWRSEMEIDVMTFLASMAGERMLFEGDNSGGVGGDLQQSTRRVIDMMAFWGMGPTLASRSMTLATRGGISARPEDGTDRMLFETDFGRAVEAKLQELLERVRVILHDNRRFVMALAHALETHLTLSGDDIEAIFRGTQGPVVDGSWYHTDDFLVSYEAYHLAAVEAHKAQVSNETPLPVLPALAPVAAGAWTLGVAPTAAAPAAPPPAVAAPNGPSGPNGPNGPNGSATGHGAAGGPNGSGEGAGPSVWAPQPRPPAGPDKEPD